MTTDILADIPHEGDSIDSLFEDKVATPSESPAENEDVVVEPEAGESNTPQEDVPFHKHPRWIERENELKRYREEIEELKNFKEQTAQTLSRVDVVDTEIPQWFSDMYGENEKAWIAYQQHEKEREEEIEQRIIQKQRDQYIKAEQESKYWVSWVDENVQRLQDEGHKFDRNEFLKLMEKYRPSDDRGNLDFDSGIELYNLSKASKPADTLKSQARKDIADTITKTDTGSPKKKDYMTPSDMRNLTWGQL